MSALPDHVSAAPIAAVLAPFRPGIAKAQRVLDRDPTLAARLEEEKRAEVVAELRRNRAEGQWEAYLANRPSEYADSTFARLEPEQDPDGKVTRWWGTDSKTLVLAGQPGRGKTDAAYAICNEVAGAGLAGGEVVTVRTVRMVDLRDLLVMVPAAHAEKDEQASMRRHQRVEGLREAALVLIDDVTAGNASSAAMQQAMHGLIDYRISNGKRTIITMNADHVKDTGPKLEATFGGAIVSRLRDRAVAAWIAGQDRRRHAPWDPFA